MVACGGSRWSRQFMVACGSRWLIVVCGGSGWLIMVLGG